MKDLLLRPFSLSGHVKSSVDTAYISTLVALGVTSVEGADPLVLGRSVIKAVLLEEPCKHDALQYPKMEATPATTTIDAKAKTSCKELSRYRMQYKLSLAHDNRKESTYAIELMRPF